MYVRPSHRPRSDADVFEIITQHMFATLVTSASSGMVASHLPFVFDAAVGERGTLYAHMARANPHAAVLDAAGDSLVIFEGPHAYVSPSWYADRATAPTWDYTAAHCYGKVRIHSFDEAGRNLDRLVRVVEAGRPAPWSVAELEPADVERMIANIVSFEIPLSRVEGKFKLHQGEKPDRTRAAVQQLELIGENALAGLIRRYNDL